MSVGASLFNTPMHAYNRKEGAEADDDSIASTRAQGRSRLRGHGVQRGRRKGEGGSRRGKLSTVAEWAPLIGRDLHALAIATLTHPPRLQ